VVTGLSLLLLFVGLQGLTGWPAQRGATTVWLAHSSLGMAYVAVLVQARLAALNPTLEEAASDLGASPFAVFRTVNEADRRAARPHLLLPRPSPLRRRRAP
jgi:putrescine transport system permease protein